MAMCYLTDRGDFDDFNRAWDEWAAGARGNAPPRATVCDVELAVPEWKVEIVVTAAM